LLLLFLNTLLIVPLNLHTFNLSYTIQPDHEAIVNSA
jgi:hypothetical protein